jgi:recombination protein RecT
MSTAKESSNGNQEQSLAKKDEVKPESERDEARLGDYLSAKLQRLGSIVPKGVDPDRLGRVAYDMIRLDDKLRLCSRESLVDCVTRAAALGLEVNPSLGHAYLIPFHVKGIGYQCELIIGYQGLITLARRSGAVADVYAYSVREKDIFEYQLGMHPDCNHLIKSREKNGELTHVYAVIKFKDPSASPHLEVMTVNEVKEIQKRSKARTGPWLTDFEMMARKTVLRRALKYCPMVPDFEETNSQFYIEHKPSEPITKIDQLTGELKNE